MCVVVDIESDSSTSPCVERSPFGDSPSLCDGLPRVYATREPLDTPHADWLHMTDFCRGSTFAAVVMALQGVANDA